jgi:hypothetical protein
LWGEASDHATDMDLDLEEAVWVAPYILPETFIYGRLGKEDSHYIFKCVGAETRKWQTKSMGTIVEIRSTGAQSVLPPSRHPDGGRYFIKSGYEDFDFKLITKMEMERYGDEIAVSAVYVHHYPDEGSRHDYVHACTGTLCHAQWPDDKIKRVMGAVLTIVQNEETEMKDRKGSVVNTIEKHAAGDRTKGLTSLEGWMAADVIQGLRRWTGSGTMEGRLLTEPVRVAPTKKDTFDFNPEWLQVPGLVGDVTRWAHKRSYIEQPVFDLATGIMCTAIASCNHYLVQHWDTPLQPYIMITAPTGAGKNSVLDVIGEFTAKILLDEHVVSGVQSFYALLDTLGEDGMLHILWDEAARSMASAKRPEAAAYQLITHLLSLYGKGNGTSRAMPGRTRSIPAIVHPFVTVLATAQPDMLMEALTSVANETGFSNRFLLLDSGLQFPSVNLQRSKVFPSVIAKQGRLLRDHQPEGDFTTIEFHSAKTYASFQEFEETSRRRAFRGEAVWGRANQSALILAGIAAVGIDPYRPEITEDLAQWAMQLTSWSNDNWSNKMRLTGGGSIREQDHMRVQRMIERPMDFQTLATDAKDHQQLSLMKQGYMPLATLTKGTSRMDKRRRMEILDDLHESDVIASMEKTHGPNGRYTNVVYFAK